MKVQSPKRGPLPNTPYIKKDGGARRTFQWLKKRGLVPVRVSSLEKAIAGALTVPFRVLSRKSQCQSMYCCRIGKS